MDGRHERVGIGGDDRESVHQLSGQLVGPLIVDAAEVESPFVFWKDIVWNLFAVLVHPFKKSIYDQDGSLVFDG